MLRIGEGYDVHKLVENRDLILGGVKIPYEKGLLGHSDADVLIHAVMDALLGACTLGDIGKFFPDNDDKFKDISSLVLIKTVSELMLEHIKSKNDKVKSIDEVINNIDATIMCERPKLRSHIDNMRKNIAEAIGIGIDRVSIKATTEEGLGFTGEGLGISARAICLLNM